MSREQAAPKRRATERAQRRRRNAPVSLCCFAGTAAPPAPHEMGMRPTAIAAGRRQWRMCGGAMVMEAAV